MKAGCRMYPSAMRRDGECPCSYCKSLRATAKAQMELLDRLAKEDDEQFWWKRSLANKQSPKEAKEDE